MNRQDRIDALTVAMGCALTKMKGAGLADFGQIPKDPILLAEKSDEYVEVLVSDDIEDLRVYIDVECVQRAARRFCAMPSAKAGERNPIPTAGEFARVCRDEWREIYRHVGTSVVRDGIEVAVVISVRRDASEADVARKIERARAKAIDTGCLALPAPKAAPVPAIETRRRMHRMLGWEAPDA